LIEKIKILILRKGGIDMKAMKLITMLGACLWLSGCILTPEGYWDFGPHHYHSNYGNGDRGFCPPGQAKKGNC
jgi:hypothetical protein